MDALKPIIAKWNRCVKCDIGKTANRHVFFRGGKTAVKILFVGEGPGRTEDHDGEPFVGRAGELIDKIIGAAGIPVEMVGFTNLVCCRPCDGKRLPNRPPNDTEIANCMPRLIAMITTIKPATVVCLGKVPARAWMDRAGSDTFRKMGLLEHGAWFLYHPAYLLRRGSEQSPEYAESVKTLRYVHMIIGGEKK